VKDMLGKEISPRIIPKILNREFEVLNSKKNATKNMKFAQDHIFEDQSFWSSV